MAVHDLSYAPWSGTPDSRFAAVRAIIGMELSRPFRNLWVRLVVIGAFMITGGWLLLLFFAASQQEMPAVFSGNKIYPCPTSANVYTSRAMRSASPTSSASSSNKA